MIVTSEMPAEWRETTLVRYLEQPYGDETLAEPAKTWIDAGEVSFAGLPRGICDAVVKRPGDDTIHPTRHRVLDELSHQFLDAARLVVGEEHYMESRVELDYAGGRVKEGSNITYHGEAHMDGKLWQGTSAWWMKKGVLRILGTAFDTLPPIVWQGAAGKNDFTGDNKTRLRAGLRDSGRFTAGYLPENRMLLLPPSLIHEGALAPHYIRRRNWVRWELFF